MDSSVIDPNPSPLARAVERNLHGHVAWVQAQHPSMRVEHYGGLTLVDSGLDSDIFNKVLAPGERDGTAAAPVGDVIGAIRQTGRPFTWWVGPCSRPLDLESMLRERELRPQEYELGMAVALATLPAPPPLAADTEIHRVDNEGRLEDFASVIAHLSDPPDANVERFFAEAAPYVLPAQGPMQLFVAYVNGTPAAVSELFAAADVAGIHMVATATAFRRRGLGLALTRRALAEGQARGLSVGALQATEDGQRVYERLGFRPCGRFVEYA